LKALLALQMVVNYPSVKTALDKIQKLRRKMDRAASSFIKSDQLIFGT
jgi:hypothetical protein